MTLGNDKKELRKGERLMVTVEEVLQNTLLVILEYRRTKFCGVLLNTSNRRGPYGLEGQPQNAYYNAYDIDPAKLEQEEKNEAKKATTKVAFPDMLSMRTTYGQKVTQPPPRQIYMRRRRSKRKVRMDMIGTDDALRIAMGYSGRKLLSHHSTCCCDTCTVWGLQKLSEADGKQQKGKRKLILEGKDGNSEDRVKSKKQKWVDGVAPLQGASKRVKVDKKGNDSDKVEKGGEKGAGHPLKRSPVIKISYKSPGGRGRVLKIPSRLHSSPTADKSGRSQRNVMQEIARKVVNRAKNEHYRYMHDQKANANGQKKLLGKILGEKGDNVKEFPNSPEKLDKVSKTPPKNLKSSPSAKSSPDKNSVAVDAVKKTLFSGKRTAKDSDSESGRSSSHVSPRKKDPRSLHPHVLLQPLTSEDTKDDRALAKIQASAPSQHSVKSKSDNHDGTVGEEANHQAPHSSAVGASGGEKSHKKQNDPAASHSISVTRCTTATGRRWCQGDVVWGKIIGFPWWPGLIQRITVKKGGGKIEQVAIVDWFQSKTVSHIPCQVLEGFSECFSKRFDRKRKGKYRHAIRDAREAEKNMSPEVRKLIVQFET